MGGLGRGDHRQYPGFGFGDHHPAADRRHCRVVDGERCGADDDLLRAEDPAPLVLPGRLVCHLCGRVADDRQFVDDDRHDRRGADGHRAGHGFPRGVDRGGDHLRRLLRRQDLAPVRYYGACVVDRRGADLHAHTLHVVYDCPVVRHRAGGFRHRGADARSYGRHACRDVCRVVARDVPHHALVAGGARGDGRADRAQTPGSSAPRFSPA